MVLIQIFILDQNGTTADSTAAAAAASAAASKAATNKTELGLLEEDDEFEEFETEDWQQDEKEAADEKDVNLWEDNWDDDNIEDDFTNQLRFVFVVFQLVRIKTLFFVFSILELNWKNVDKSLSYLKKKILFSFFYN